MRDVPLVKGSRLKLVLGMKGGPVSARRVVTLPDYDRWFDLNDILNTSRYVRHTIRCHVYITTNSPSYTFTDKIR